MQRGIEPPEQPSLAEVVRFTPLDWILLLLMAGCLVGILLRPPFLDAATFALWGGVFFTLIVWNMVHRLTREIQRLRERINRLETLVKNLRDSLDKKRNVY